MIGFKQLFNNSFRTLKRHYLLMVIVCLIAGFIGTEFLFSTMAIKERMGGESGSSSTMEQVVDTVLMHEGDFRKLPAKILDILSGSENMSEEFLNELLNHINHKGVTDLVHDHKRTITAFANVTSAGRAIVRIGQYVFDYGVSGQFWPIIVILMAFVIYECITCFYFDVYGIAYRRVVLESRMYDNIYAPRFAMLIKVNCWFKAGFALLVKNLYYFLWCFTIVGAFIKRYSYYMVPYILAENPTLKPVDAITISRRMMNGHKWQCFLIDVMFIPASIVEILTLGVTGIFITNPIKAALFAEYYANLREKALEEGIINKTLLNDKYLFEPAPIGELVEAYDKTIAELDEKLEQPVESYKGIRKLFSDWLGVVIYADRISTENDRRNSDTIHLRRLIDARENRAYPTRLSELERRYSGHWIDRINYNRQYSITSLIWMFIIVSFGGWIWEVALHIVQTGDYVNRGALYGPWLPIYGAGCCLMLMVLKKLRNKPLVFFIAAVLLCGTVEYFTSYVMEMQSGIRYWDYHGYMLNLNGRICAEGVIAFGLAGLGGIYLICPMVDRVICHFPKMIMTTLAVILAVVFMTDNFYSTQHPRSGAGITVQNDNTTMNNNSEME